MQGGFRYAIGISSRRVTRQKRVTRRVFATSPFLTFSDGLTAWKDRLKKRDQRYCSGKNLGWVKVKCAAWREANRD
jgi:hypothetical protein